MLKQIILFLIKIYQRISGLFLARHCRFYPSCSHYVCLAIEKDGLFKGSIKSAWRILRCNPLAKPGIDLP